MSVIEVNGKSYDVAEKLTALGMKRMIGAPSRYWLLQFKLPHEPDKCKCFACQTWKRHGRYLWELSDHRSKNMYFVNHWEKNVRFYPVVEGERFIVYRDGTIPFA